MKNGARLDVKQEGAAVATAVRLRPTFDSGGGSTTQRHPQSMVARRSAAARGDPDPELHLILIWHNALDQADRILADAQAHFTVCDVLRIHWSRERFSQNLTRFYDYDLPPGSDKERHCGAGEFIAIVAEDASPAYAPRPVSRGGRERVNTTIHAAKARYREWTGGGHRVHTTLDPSEFEHDTFLLLGQRADAYRPGACPAWDGTISDVRADLAGTNGWETEGQLIRALELTGRFAVLDRETGRLTILVEDFWSATVMARCSTPGNEAQEVTIGASPRTLELHGVRRGHLDPDWEADILDRRTRDPGGTPVASPEDRRHYLLHRGLFHEPELLRRRAAELGPLADPAEARRALDRYFGRMGYGRARVRGPAEPPPPPRARRLAGAVKRRAVRAGARFLGRS